MKKLKLNVGDTVYKKVEKRRQRGFLYPEHDVREGKVTKVGRKYAPVNYGDERFTNIDQVPLEDLSKLDRHKKYFLNLKEYELLKDKMDGERELNSFFRDGFGNNAQDLSHKHVIAIRDIIWEHKKGES